VRAPHHPIGKVRAMTTLGRMLFAVAIGAAILPAVPVRSAAASLVAAGY
jgi:hypothetical protein